MILVNMNGEKDIISVTCKNHSTRSEKDLYKVCPSKLSKSELEDIYFALFESNIQLKRTLNGQQDEIKLLTTKVQRLTAQKPIGHRYKDCCVKNMAIINEQKESIADLKKINEKLSDRNRFLNIKLCSTKQYLRRSSAPPTARCSKCCLVLNTSIKNSSMSALYTKRSEANFRTAATSCEYLNKVNAAVMQTKIVSTQTENKLQEDCEQNKCRTTIEDLKQKIIVLEEELAGTHDKYLERLKKLDKEVSTLRVENTRRRSERAAGEQRTEALQHQLSSQLEQLRAAEGKCDELTAQLMIEKAKVSELEMLLKSADISRQVAVTLEKQIKNTLLLVPNNLNTSKCEGSPNKIVSDDSGYTESNGSPKKESYLDQSILDQIASLKVELDSLKLSISNDQKDVFKEKMLNFEGTSQDIGVNFSTSGFNDPNIENILPNPSTLEAKELTLDNTLNEQFIHSGQTDTMDKTLKSKSLTVSNIPRLNKNVPKVMKDKQLRDTNSTNIDRSENLALDEENSNSNEKTQDFNMNSEVNNSNNVANSKVDEVTSNENDSSNIKSRLSKEDSVNSDSQTTKTDISQITNRNIDENVDRQISNDFNDRRDMGNDKKNTNDPNNEKNNDSAIVNNDKFNNDNICKGDTSKNGILESNRGESSKVKSRSFDKQDRKVRNVVEDLSKEKIGKRLKRRMSYVIEKKASEGKLDRVASDDGIGSKTYSLPKRPVATSSPNQGTYILKGTDHVSSSPDNTDCEISSLTDLPQEIDDRSPYDYISPGEERGVTTYSESFATTTDYGSLSEGELPFTGRRSSYSYGDVRRQAETIGTQSSSNMEQTLKAIGDEVTRCKRLLRGQMTFPDAAFTHNYNTLTFN